ncbi:MAG: response regulator [Deltaproteobacteria bacterium]|nr:response regulator [Deltaproteobacteria bacterium]
MPTDYARTEQLRRQRAAQGAGWVILAQAAGFGGWALVTGQWTDVVGNVVGLVLVGALIVAARRGHVLTAGYGFTLLGTAGVVAAGLLRGNPGNAPFYVVLGVMLSPMILPPKHVVVVVAVALAGEAVLAFGPSSSEPVQPLINVYAEGAFLCALGGAMAIATSVSVRRLLGELEQRSVDARAARERADALALKLEHSQRMEARGLLAGSVAHDFNNLLTVIRGCASLLEEEAGLQGEAAKDVRDIIGAAERGSALTSRLLTFSRRDVVRTMELDPCAVVEAMGDIVQRLVGKQVRVTMETSGGPLVVIASASQLEQIVMNLAVNARDAMAGKGELRVRVERGDDAQLGRVCRLVVADTGAGMTDEVRQRMFEPFFTTKAPGKGTGLGLSTVFGVTASLGGRIDVDSTPGRGSTFTVLLPLAAEGARAAADIPPTSHEDHRPRSVAIVDDDARVRSLMARIVGAADMTPHTFDSAEALLATALDAIDIVITDVNLHGMSGIELADQLLARPRAPRVVLVSGYSPDPRAIARLLEKGATFLAKPFTPGQLAAAVSLDASAVARRGPSAAPVP